MNLDEKRSRHMGTASLSATAKGLNFTSDKSALHIARLSHCHGMRGVTERRDGQTRRRSLCVSARGRDFRPGPRARRSAMPSARRAPRRRCANVLLRISTSTTCAILDGPRSRTYGDEHVPHRLDGLSFRPGGPSPKKGFHREPQSLRRLQAIEDEIASPSRAVRRAPRCARVYLPTLPRVARGPRGLES